MSLKPIHPQLISSLSLSWFKLNLRHVFAQKIRAVYIHAVVPHAIGRGMGTYTILFERLTSLLKDKSLYLTILQVRERERDSPQEEKRMH